MGAAIEHAAGFILDWVGDHDWMGVGVRRLRGTISFLNKKGIAPQWPTLP